MSSALLARMSAISHGGAAPSELQSVVAHLTLLLNTRQGSSSIDARLGMTDFSDAMRNFPIGITTLQRMVTDLIRQYEPRLKHVTVRPLAPSTAQLSLSFEVRAELRCGARVQLQTQLSHNGQVSIT